MSDLMSSSALPLALTALNTGGLIVSHCTLSRRIKRIEKFGCGSHNSGVPMNIAASSGPPDQDADVMEMKQEISQLRSENEVLTRKLLSHEAAITQLVHDYKVRAAAGHAGPALQQQLAGQHYHSASQSDLNRSGNLRTVSQRSTNGASAAEEYAKSQSGRRSESKDRARTSAPAMRLAPSVSLAELDNSDVESTIPSSDSESDEDTDAKALAYLGTL